MKIERVMSLGYQGVLVKEPFSEQLAALRLIAILSRMGIPTRKCPWQIFLLSGKKPLGEGILRKIRKMENVRMYQKGELAVYLICDGKHMVSLFKDLPKDDWTLEEVSAVCFLHFLKNREVKKNV